MVPQTATARPALVPVAVEWSDELLRRREHLVTIDVGDASTPLFGVDLRIIDYTESGQLRFRVSIAVDGDVRSSDFEVRFGPNGVRYVLDGGPLAFINVGGRRTALVEWFRDNPPAVYFANGALLLGDELFTPPRMDDRIPYSRERIEAWNWAGTNICEESQKTQKRPDGIVTLTSRCRNDWAG
ncbi:hypothetical protein M0638_28535, partial [Roseomonas sp. NAR14]